MNIIKSKKKLLVLILIISIIATSLIFSVVSHSTSIPVTWNPNDKGTDIVLSDNNMSAVTNGNFQSVRATLPKSSGKWYWELKLKVSTINPSGSDCNFGIVNALAQLSGGSLCFVGANNGVGYCSAGYFYSNCEYIRDLPTFNKDDILAIKLDVDNSTIVWLKNNIQIYSTTYQLSGDVFAAVNGYNGAGYTANFGATTFTYPIPEGYLAYDGSGTPTPTITPTSTPIPTPTLAPTPTPIPSGNRAVLAISYTNNTLKEYDISVAEVSNFVSWFTNKSNGAGSSSYMLNVNSNVKPFISREEYILFDKIFSFEIKYYIVN